MGDFVTSRQIGLVTCLVHLPFKSVKFFATIYSIQSVFY